MNPNLRAALDALAFSEGTSTHPLTKHNGYDVIVTGVDGPEVFTDFSTHPFCTDPRRPPKLINKAGLTSTASGRYQLLARYYPIYKVQLKLADFGPDAQDAIAIQQIKECRALDDVLTGNIQRALAKCASRWASLPGSGYGQPERKLEQLIAAYQQAGGVVA